MRLSEVGRSPSQDFVLLLQQLDPTAQLASLQGLRGDLCGRCGGGGLSGFSDLVLQGGLADAEVGGDACQ